MTTSELRIAIGKIIRETRVDCGLSVDELAELVGVTPGFQGLMERGARGTTPLTLLKLSNIFNVPVDYFFFKTEYKTNCGNPQINALINDFTEPEINFVIHILKGMRTGWPKNKIE